MDPASPPAVQAAAWAPAVEAKQKEREEENDKETDDRKDIPTFVDNRVVSLVALNALFCCVLCFVLNAVFLNVVFCVSKRYLNARLHII